MKKIICITVIYLFLLAAPLNSSEFAMPMPTGSAAQLQSIETQDTRGLADNLSFISAGVVNTLMGMLGE
ncbi:hypothetical protein Dthio_PD1391 [Desulfonatronospira thiodismutans ASO3-1]|uniref:Uncharacterized protein n=1 Tax=Desulfonatronospira thiodismutans ASO3-1 TaxID=555779 RepID=D6STN6_9BACT|nr:hypothetical protein [Desulfonatronospira thiodismutans]EFI34052.1 hypothetical protein Dthio_PD1391 [Desulfonatronospira thiodismutans ASO3-1]